MIKLNKKKKNVCEYYVLTHEMNSKNKETEESSPQKNDLYKKQYKT